MQEEPETFAQFWKVYPRRIARAAAVRMYRRALKITTPEIILRGAMRYAQERMGQDHAYTKHPATWLNGACWDDELPMVPKAVGPRAVLAPDEPADPAMCERVGRMMAGLAAELRMRNQGAAEAERRREREATQRRREELAARGIPMRPPRKAVTPELARVVQRWQQEEA